MGGVGLINKSVISDVPSVVQRVYYVLYLA